MAALYGNRRSQPRGTARVRRLSRRQDEPRTGNFVAYRARHALEPYRWTRHAGRAAFRISPPARGTPPDPCNPLSRTPLGLAISVHVARSRALSRPQAPARTLCAAIAAGLAGFR